MTYLNINKGNEHPEEFAKQEDLLLDVEKILETHMDEIDPHGTVGVSIPQEIMVDPVGETAGYLAKKILQLFEEERRELFGLIEDEEPNAFARLYPKLSRYLKGEQ